MAQLGATDGKEPTAIGGTERISAIAVVWGEPAHRGAAFLLTVQTPTGETARRYVFAPWLASRVAAECMAQMWCDAQGSAVTGPGHPDGAGAPARLVQGEGERGMAHHCDAQGCGATHRCDEAGCTSTGYPCSAPTDEEPRSVYCPTHATIHGYSMAASDDLPWYPIHYVKETSDEPR